MAKLTKTQQATLLQILNHILGASAYLKQEDIVIARKNTSATTTLHYTRAIDNEALFVVDKEIGTPLARLWTAEDALRKFIFNN